MNEDRTGILILGTSGPRPGGEPRRARAFGALDEALLAADGGADGRAAFDEGALSPSRRAAFEGRLAEMLEDAFGEAPVVVLDGPLLPRVVPFYLRVLRSSGAGVRCLHAVRDPVETARSLADGEGVPAAASALMWLRGTLEAEHASRGCDRLFAHDRDAIFGDAAAIRHPAERGAASSRGAAPDDGVAARLAGAGDALSRLLAEAYGAILSLRSDPMRADALAVLDGCRARLDGADDLSGHAFRELVARERAVRAAPVAELATAAADDGGAADVEEEPAPVRPRPRPLRALRRRIVHRGTLALSRMLATSRPDLSRKYARSAAKRDPMRPAMPVARNGAFDGDPRDRTPTLLLPFGTTLTRPRPPVRIAVVLHVYYMDQAPAFRRALEAIPVPFSLFVSTDSEEKARVLRAQFADGPARWTQVRAMPNRGRDIAPKMVGFADVYDDHDLVLFPHTKASMHNSDLLAGWCGHLVTALLGSRRTVESILDAFAAAPALGMLAPPNLSAIRNNVNWGVNYDACHALAGRMGLTLFPDSPVDFPAGSMFWARTAAMRPLLDAGIGIGDFQEEAGQNDATFAHAVERLFFYSCEMAGLRWLHAGTAEQMVPADRPVRVTGQADLDRAVSDRMPALLLPGTRPGVRAADGAPVRLARVGGDARGA